MAEMNTNHSVFDDTPTMILIGAIGLLATFVLTPIGFIGIAIPITLYRLSGRPDWVVVCVGLSLLVLTTASIMGGTAGLWGAYKAVAGTFLEPSFDLITLLRRWIRLGLLREAWLLLLPLGGLIGAVIALGEHGGQNSQLAALMRGQIVAPLKRAPLADWFQRKIGTKPARRNGSIVLGGDWRTGQAVAISDDDLNRHVLMAGTTGAGKTVGLLNVIDGSPGIGTVIVDGKGDIQLARRVTALARARGQKTYLFDGTQESKSSVYNPFASGDYTGLSDRIVTLREWSEPYYLSLATGFAQTAFRVLQACGHRVDLITAEECLSSRFLIALIRRSRKTGETYQKLAAEITSQKKAEEQIEGLRSDLRNLTGSVLAPLFDTARAAKDRVPIIDLQRARTENAVVYFCLPALKYPKLAGLLGRLIVNDIKAATATSRSPWRIILDEFSVFAGPQVLNLINMGRGFGVSAVLATQSFADIAQGGEKDGDKFLDQVIGSLNTYLVYRLNSPNDCELAASLAGTCENVEFTAQTANGVGTGAASARHTRSFRIHPDVVKSLDVGEAIYINKNRPPWRNKNYLKIKCRQSVF